MASAKTALVFSRDGETLTIETVLVSRGEFEDELERLTREALKVLVASLEAAGARFQTPAEPKERYDS